MTAFPITEARARFCYHFGVTHTVMSERRAGELMAAHAVAEGKRPALPVMPKGGIDPQKLIRPEVVLPMLDAGMSAREIAAELGVSPSTIWDRVRFWRPQRGGKA